MQWPSWMVKLTNFWKELCRCYPEVKMLHQSSLADCFDITCSCFVFATAGSGKTSLLVGRYIKSLLYGIQPREILCLTFTKVAAYEMESRIIAIIEKLYLNEDGFTERYLRTHLKIENPSDAMLKTAEKLFFQLQDDIHSLKIMTLHSFCKDLLLKFPLESGLNTDFEIVDENDVTKLMKSAIRNSFALLEKNNLEDVKFLSSIISDYSIKELINKVLLSPSKVLNFFQENENIERYEQVLEAVFNLGEVTEFSNELRNYISEFLHNKNLEDVCLTKSGAIRKRLSGINLEIANIVYKNNVFKKKKTLIKKTISFLKIIKVILTEYQYLKNQSNVVDFDEILHLTKCLFTKSEAKEFITSKLCESIKCVMIDEAQDLSKLQWDLITIFSEGILMDQSGLKTIFAVGDPRQSIYRFQGTDSNSFHRFHQLCGEWLLPLGRRINTVHLNESFRSLPRILEAVDVIFKNHQLAQRYQPHVANRRDGAGVVEFVELISETPSEYAEEIATYIQNLGVIDSETLILTRSRNELSEKLMQALSRLEVAVAPPERTSISQNLFIMDIVSLLNYCVNDNEYDLCCILKSPYFFETPLLDDDLFNLCRDGDILTNLKSKYFDKWEIMYDVMKHYEVNSLVEFCYFILSYTVRKFSQNDDFTIAMFMNIIISFSKKISNAIPEFLNYIKETDIKILTENFRQSGVKLMTIHGAKGLEFPVVCLLDFSLRADKNKTKVIWNNDLFFLKPSKNDSFDEIDSISENEHIEEEKELYRLLYVAMTRARDRLYIFGKQSGDLHKIFASVFNNTSQNRS